MSKRKAGESTKVPAKQRQKYALVYYVADKTTGVVFASEIKSKPKLGSKVRVPDPFDWKGEKSTSKYDALLIKYGYDPEFLYTNIFINKANGIEIKSIDNLENIELATRKKEEGLELLAKNTEIALSNDRVRSRTPLFPPDKGTVAISEIPTSTASATITSSDPPPENAKDSVPNAPQVHEILISSPGTSQSQDLDFAEPPQPSGTSKTPTGNSEVLSSSYNTQIQSKITALCSNRSHDPVSNAVTPQPSGSGSTRNIVDNTFNYEEFVKVASEAITARKRLSIKALPRLECLIPSPNKVAIGENQNVFITRQQAINMPWVVPQPPGRKKCRVPEDQPTAVYPRKFVTYLLGCLLPPEIAVHLRGPTIPKILFAAITDYLNGRMEKRQKLSSAYITGLISDCARKFHQKENDDDDDN